MQMQIGPINDSSAQNALRANQLRLGLGTVALIAGFTGYMLRSIFSPEHKCRRDLDKCARWVSNAIIATGERHKRQAAVEDAVKRIRRIGANAGKKRRLH